MSSPFYWAANDCSYFNFIQIPSKQNFLKKNEIYENVSGTSFEMNEVFCLLIARCETLSSRGGRVQFGPPLPPFLMVPDLSSLVSKNRFRIIC